MQRHGHVLSRQAAHEFLLGQVEDGALPLELAKDPRDQATEGIRDQLCHERILRAGGDQCHFRRAGAGASLRAGGSSCTSR